MSKMRSNIISLCLVSLGILIAFLLNYFSGWLLGKNFLETLIVAFILGTIEFISVQKLTDEIPTYYRLDDNMAFPYISIGFAVVMIMFKN